MKKNLEIRQSIAGKNRKIFQSETGGKIVNGGPSVARWHHEICQFAPETIAKFDNQSREEKIRKIVPRSRVKNCKFGYSVAGKISWNSSIDRMKKISKFVSLSLAKIAKLFSHTEKKEREFDSPRSFKKLVIFFRDRLSRFVIFFRDWLTEFSIFTR